MFQDVIKQIRTTLLLQQREEAAISYHVSRVTAGSAAGKWLIFFFNMEAAD